MDNDSRYTIGIGIITGIYSGSAPTDEMGTTLEVSVTDMMPAPFYTGIIETVDGDINAPANP